MESKCLMVLRDAIVVRLGLLRLIFPVVLDVTYKLTILGYRNLVQSNHLLKA